MKRIHLLALVGLLALPVAGTLQAQQPSDKAQSRMQADSAHRFRPGMRRGMRGGFAAHLLAQRAQLGLTDRQVGQLTEIQKQYQERNEALMTQSRRGRTAERAAYMKAHPEMRQTMDQLRQNREAERKEIESVLTAEQKAQLQQRMQQFQRQGGRGWSGDSARAGRK